LGFVCSNKARAPATAGVAMDVPESSRVLLSPVELALVIVAPVQRNKKIEEKNEYYIFFKIYY